MKFCVSSPINAMKVSAFYPGLLAALLGPLSLSGQAVDVQITGVPDYDWYAGCFGTACGNLMGYWDRHGLPDFYTGPTGAGLAPLNSSGANVGIRSLWASRAGFDGRSVNLPGHIDDYWRVYASDSVFSYEDTDDDPYVLAGRPEHAPDCVGDFIGLSQKKFTGMNNECDGNLDAYSFVFWATNGARRTNFSKAVDIQSGLRAWAKSKGCDADVFTQLADFNPGTPAGQGFTWADLKAEMDAGYPLLVFLQNNDQTFRSLGPIAHANPEIHGMLACGYEEHPDIGVRYVYVRTSWASGEGVYRSWSTEPWVAAGLPLHVRGVIGFHPHPRVRSIAREGTSVSIRWDGPSSLVTHHDQAADTFTDVQPHRYQLQQSPTLQPPSFTDVGPSTTNLTITVEACCAASAFYRVKLISP
jgi:hypothetical protein